MNVIDIAHTVQGLNLPRGFKTAEYVKLFTVSFPEFSKSYFFKIRYFSNQKRY